MTDTAAVGGPLPDIAPAEPDRKGLLNELAGIIWSIPLPARNKDVTDLRAWLISHGLSTAGL